MFMRRGIAVLGVEGLGCRGGVKTHSLSTCIPILAVGGCNGMKLPGISPKGPKDPIIRYLGYGQ